MPFINVRTTKTITKEAEDALRAALGKAISIIPGKSEGWLMLGFEDNCRMAFSGMAEPDIAFIEVQLLGSADNAIYNKLTATLCEIISSVLQIAGSRIYVKYEETQHWGWNGTNF